MRTILIKGIYMRKTNSKEIKQDITIIGAGAAGLMTATFLTEKGYQVGIVEKSDSVCNGPSIRNEGWLHAGTYHSTSIKDKDKALEVANRCKYGFKTISKMAPESIEEKDMESYAVFKDEEYAEYAKQRWSDAQILFRSILLREFIKKCPEINMEPIKQVYRVNDLSINTPKLYRNLVNRIQRENGDFYLQSILEVDQNQQAWIRSLKSGERNPLNSQLVINTTGYGMSQFLEQYFGEEFFMRFWKSHLIIYPSLGKHNVFYLEPGEAAAFHHGRVTMVGQHEDATVIESSNFDPIKEKAEKVRQATGNLYLNSKGSPFLDTACLKPDLSSNSSEARSLGVEVHEPQQGYLFALPGKMTESPFLANQLVQMVESRVTASKNKKTSKKYMFQLLQGHVIIGLPSSILKSSYHERFRLSFSWNNICGC